MLDFEWTGHLLLLFGDIVIEVLRTNTGDEPPQITSSWKREAAPKSQTKTKRVEESRKVDQLSQVDHVPANTRISQGGPKLYIFEDSEAVVKMIIKERSPTMRHVSSTHRVALDWLFDRFMWELKI